MDKKHKVSFAENRLQRGYSDGVLGLFDNMSDQTIFLKLKELLKPGGLPELGPGPRTGVVPLKKLDEAINELLTNSNLPETLRELVRGLILLWHDHMEPAHEIAQAIENPDGSFLHGILHRREPDYGNAAYWFRRVGRHKCFSEMAKRVSTLLKAKNEPSMQNQLMRGGEWDGFAFIDACEKVSGKNPDEALVKLLREIQGIETEVLLEEWATR